METKVTKITRSINSDLAPEVGIPTSLANRYRYVSTLGRGGMAVVFLVESLSDGSMLAFKRLLPSDRPSHAVRAQELFEREYLTLSQISHPCVVQVHDFGVADGTSYYTMEHLQPGALNGVGAMPWRTVCQLGRELCSALSLLHSRRWVFRDLSPNNVLFSMTGRAKLIDFGAMAEMGKAQSPVCTPAVAAPELLQSLPIDGRADLFALGATLYHALTGRHAFPARKFSQLTTLWQNPPRLPSHYASDIPDALDRLILELLQVEVDLRPSNAGEVAEQLCVIGDLAEDGQLQAASAYLATPKLVAREQPLATLRGRMKRLGVQGHGGSLLISGASGVGRTRLLDAAYLETCILGLSTVRCSAASAREGSFGGLRAIANELLAVVPEAAVSAAAPNWAVLSELIPELLDHANRLPKTQPEAIVTVATPALRAWIRRVTALQPTIILVDDMHRLDVETQALVALLASDARNQSYLLIVSTLEGVGGDALEVLRRSSRHLSVAALSIEGSDQLLASIFGDVPNLPYVVNRLHKITNGNAQGLMRLAQHMLHLGLCERRDGGWILPEYVDSMQLPEDMTAALAAVAASLGDGSQRLASALGACEILTFSLAECCALSQPAPKSEVVGMIDELVAASVLERRDAKVCLAGQGWGAALPQSEDTLQQTHLRLAAVFTRRGDGVRAARFFASAGVPVEAVATLVKFSEVSTRATDSDPAAYLSLLMSIPSDWASVFYQTIALAVEQNSSCRDLFLLRSRLIGLCSPTDIPLGADMFWLVDRLAEDCGLDLLAHLPSDTPAEERLPMALKQAAERNSARKPHEQLFAPAEAVPALCRALVAGISSFSNTLDVIAWDKMPSLSPLTALSPAVDLISQLGTGFDARIKGRLGHARAVYVRIIEAVERGDARGSLEPTYANNMKSGVAVIVAMMDAALGQPSWQAWLEIVAQQELHAASCLSIRSVSELWQGNTRGAEAIEEQRTLRKLESPLPQSFESFALLLRTAAYALIGDSTRLDEHRVAIARMVERAPAWKPVSHWVQGALAVARGDYPGALQEQTAALDSMSAAGHPVWPWAAASRVNAFLLCGDVGGAVVAGEGYLALGRKNELGHALIYTQLALAEAHALRGDSEPANQLVKLSLDAVETLGASGLLVGLVHESATKVALALGNQGTAEHHFVACEREYGKHRNRDLRRKLKRLAVARAQATESGYLTDGADVSLAPTVDETSEWLSELEDAASEEVRLARALRIAIAECNGVAAAFYGWAAEGPVILATAGEFQSSAQASIMFGAILREAIEPAPTRTSNMTQEGSTEPALLSFEDHAFRAELVSQETPDGTLVSGLLVLTTTPETDTRPLAKLASILGGLLARSESITVKTAIE